MRVNGPSQHGTPKIRISDEGGHVGYSHSPHCLNISPDHQFVASILACSSERADTLVAWLMIPSVVLWSGVVFLVLLSQLSCDIFDIHTYSKSRFNYECVSIVLHAPDAVYEEV